MVKIKEEILKYSLASLAATGVDLGIFSLMVNLALLKKLKKSALIRIATIVSRFVSTSFNYIRKNKYVFGNEEQSKSAFLKFLIINLIKMSMSAYLVDIISTAFVVNLTLLKAVIDTLLFFVAYIFEKKYVF